MHYLSHACCRVLRGGGGGQFENDVDVLFVRQSSGDKDKTCHTHCGRSGHRKLESRKLNGEQEERATVATSSNANKAPAPDANAMTATANAAHTDIPFIEVACFCLATARPNIVFCNSRKGHTEHALKLDSEGWVCQHHATAEVDAHATRWRRNTLTRSHLRAHTMQRWHIRWAVRHTAPCDSDALGGQRTTPCHNTRRQYVEPSTAQPQYDGWQCATPQHAATRRARHTTTPRQASNT